MCYSYDDPRVLSCTIMRCGDCFLQRIQSMMSTSNHELGSINMAKIQYDFDIEGVLQDDPFLDRYQIALMFEQTKQSIERSLRRKLTGITCDEHHSKPVITITGRYNSEHEELDIQYHLDTCCQLFMVQVIKILNSAP